MERLERLRILHARTPAGPTLDLAIAEGFAARLLGLIGLPELPPERGIFIPGCRSLHTLGMRCAIDVVFVAARPGRLDVVAVHENVSPFRFVACRGPGTDVIEVASGLAELTEIRPGASLVTER